MIPGLETLACQELAVPMEIMEHVVWVESSFNPFAIGVVGARLARQPRSLAEAVATAERLERDGYNFSIGLAQVNRHNLEAQGLASYEHAFAPCPNLAAGARILAECHARAGGDWSRAFSCYYSGNFTAGFRDGYVDKVRRSMAQGGVSVPPEQAGRDTPPPAGPLRRGDLVSRRSASATRSSNPGGTPAAPTVAQGVEGLAEAHVDPGPRASPAPFVPAVSGGHARDLPRSPPGTDPHHPGGDAAFVF